MKLIGQIEKVIYENEGFFIGVLASGEKVSGHYHDSSIESIEKAAVTLTGEYKEHPKYGRTFEFHTLNVNQHELFFFLNRVVKGFPKRLTAELIERFGESGLIEILDNDIEKLAEFSGIKQKRLERIRARWKQFRSMRELGSFLAPYDVSPAMITTIAGAMKEVADAAEKIRRDPYILAGISGIGFRRADAIASKMGVEPVDERRLSAAMEYAIARRCERDGNSRIEKADLFSELDTLLQDPEASHYYAAVLAERIADESILPTGDSGLSPTRLYEAERFIFETLRRRTRSQSEAITEDLEAFLEAAEPKPGSEQRRAVEMLNRGINVLCLVGYAGTGKSTTAKLLLELLSKRCGRERIITCALSGIAAQRIGDVSGFDSATIQSLLVRFEDRDQMPYSVVLIDEASMINAPLFARLLAKCHRDATIIIVGDDAQLPPIGAGDVLADIISYELVPVVKLTKIYRQSEKQAIAVIANAIRRGEVPNLEGPYADFSFTAVPSLQWQEREAHSQAVLSEIVSAAIEAIPEGRRFLKEKRLREYLMHFQVISPMKGGILGTENLNRVLQSYFNPSAKQSVSRAGKSFALMDKVVHTRNDNLPSWSMEGYKSDAPSEINRIYNGMSGLLFQIDESAEQVYVVYPVEGVVVRYDFAQLATHLMLAYALTVHKVQGMEYDTVAIPSSFSHFVMLGKKLLYTAVTRAKKRCLVIGEAEAFTQAVLRHDHTTRQTVLQYLSEGKKAAGR